MGGRYKQDLHHATLSVCVPRKRQRDILTSNEGQIWECVTLSFKFPSDKILINFNPGWQVRTRGLGAEAGGGVMGVCDELQYDVSVSLWQTSIAVPICGLAHLSKPASVPAAATH